MSEKTWPEVWPADWPHKIYATKRLCYDVRDIVEGYLSEQTFPIVLKDIVDTVVDLAYEDMYEIRIGFDLVAGFEDEFGDVVREELLPFEESSDS